MLIVFVGRDSVISWTNR